jgi:peptidoglycan/xylan/chitin deacetylase (PgdA/CDA1 family)
MESQAARYRDIAQSRLAEHRALGNAERHFFAHRIRHLRRCGPDGLQLASRMCRVRDPEALWEIAIHALPPAIDHFPEELFFDADLIWHQRHLGLPGHVATASVALDGRTVWCVTYLSDIVQRSSRRQDYRTRIDNRFKGWTLWMLNDVLDFARERGCTEVRSPTSDLVLQHTDPARTAQPEIYRRIYDRSVTRWFEATRRGPWWVLDVERNARRLLRPEPGSTSVAAERTICVCHDIERGLGHRGVDPALTKLADAAADRWLDEMLNVEQAAGVKATYNVVARLLPDVRGRIEAGRHAIGFHSYDHSIDVWWPVSQWSRRIRRRFVPSAAADATPIDQVTGCREVDYRIRGYRPPRSRITRELNDTNLCWHNFEWLASSTHSLRLDSPTLRRRVVRLPILVDDYPLYTHRLTWQEWEARVLHSVARRDFTAVSLHDCYAASWLPHYGALLDRLQQLGRLVTLDEVAARTFLTTAA